MSMPLPAVRMPVKKFAFRILYSFLILGSAFFSFKLGDAGAASLAGEKTLVLYDAAWGAVPGTPLVAFTDFPPGSALTTYSDGAAVLDTTAMGRDSLAGWTSQGTTTPGFPILDRTAGFRIDFTLQVESESHKNNNRAGLSLILLGQDATGIELAFWENEIWAQSDRATGGLFKHGEGVAFPTTAGLTEYQLTVVGDTYILAANSQSILTGPVRDYSEFDGFPDPYETPNFIFLGDNTTSAQARVRLRFVSVTGVEPVLPTATSTSAGTSSPPPRTSSTPLSSPTPVPSPTPPGRVFKLCPSGPVFLAIMIAIPLLLKGLRGKPWIGSEAAQKKTMMDRNRLL